MKIIGRVASERLAPQPLFSGVGSVAVGASVVTGSVVGVAVVSGSVASAVVSSVLGSTRSRVRVN